MLGTTVAQYRIISRIGAGGMGTVYLAEDTNLKRRVALKFLHAEATGSREGAARLLREARAASALDHSHIATIYQIGEHAGQPFIAMAYYDGETLEARIARGQMSIVDIARIVGEMADALAAAHAADIVHRDLKPSNAMLTGTGTLKVLDFGIAKIETAETATKLTGEGSTLGTAAYMSPEQAAGKVVDARSDVWSLGVVTYEMLAGRRPFDGTNALAIINAVLTTTPAPIRSLRPDVPRQLEDIVNQTIVRDRDRRTIAAADVRDLASACHAELSAGVRPPVVRSRTSQRIRLATAVVALIAIASGVAWWAHHNSRVRWARQEALPEIIRLAGADQFDAAYILAQEAQSYIPDDPILAEQIRGIARPAVIDSEPPGANVFYRPYNRGDAPWRPLGKTPIAGAVVPRGLLQWKSELAGHEIAEDVGPGPFDSTADIRFELFPPDRVPAGMVRIASRDRQFQVGMPTLEHLSAVQLPDYWIDRYEVRNRAYKRFMDDGGYRRPELWEPFLKDGRTLTFDEAMKYFHDSTGQPGPAEWEQGTYAAGQDEYPVGGVSWYEAMAYARWARKSLPTIYHWSRAAGLPLSGDVVPASNFHGKSPVPGGTSHGINRGGTNDMGGNVKEWVLNAAGANRYILGGAWNEPVYMFNNTDVQLPLSRLPTYGFRCIQLDGPGDLSPALTADIIAPTRDWRNIKPVSAEVFEGWKKSLYSFDHGALKEKVESVDDTSPEWRKEKVSYAAAYGGERIPAYLFLPKNATPPYQVMIGFPGANVFFERSSATTTNIDRFTFIVRSGRAFLYPIYKSTFERGDGRKSDTPDMTADFRDHMVMWSKDVGRSVDYLESRSDIAKDKIGYIGLSSGATLGPVFLAIERRITLGVLYMGGINLQPSRPEADTVNFAPHVRVPVLMLSGKFDNYYPTVSSQLPLFELLGTPDEHKQRREHDAAHSIPRAVMIKEVVDWMDKYWEKPTPR
jgi:eukaryotic-like serine/threonine-protein kinase